MTSDRLKDLRKRYSKYPDVQELFLEIERLERSKWELARNFRMAMAFMRGRTHLGLARTYGLKVVEVERILRTML